MSESPAIGTPVLYRITASQAEDVNARRDAFRQTYAAAGYAMTGHQEHHGNPAEEGQQLTALVVNRYDVFPGVVNLVVFLDGNDTLWAPSVEEDDKPEEKRPGFFTLADRRVQTPPVLALHESVLASATDTAALEHESDQQDLALLDQTAGDEPEPAPAKDKPETPIPADNDGPIIVGG